ncbi:hypothetical protein [Paroceanicella profunda]|uniref:hypothetical protein n=1 Tax=Paroceanicella profunda TaxID=2579971 RepID=UPI0014784D45|nr:hypothetical protein [Paroceanicella profunda]
MYAPDLCPDLLMADAQATPDFAARAVDTDAAWFPRRGGGIPPSGTSATAR